VPNWPEKREGIMKCVAEHAALRDATMDLTDGFKFTGPDIWIHIRASQTEPVVRIVSEGVEEVKVKKLVKEVEAICVA
jgi:phosphomannomutase